jgi:hypothetical protein
MMVGWEDQSTRRKTCPIAILATKNAMWTILILNLGLCGEKSVTNCLRLLLKLCFEL